MHRLDINGDGQRMFMGRRVREGGLKDETSGCRKLLPDINRGGRGLRRSFRRCHAPEPMLTFEPHLLQRSQLI